MEIIEVNGKRYREFLDVPAECKGLPCVLVRTYSAGIHFGYLESHSGTQVVLKNSRRIWSWTGCFTLSEISCCKTKPGAETRISCKVGEIILTEAIEIIKLTENAIAELYSIKDYEIN